MDTKVRCFQTGGCECNDGHSASGSSWRRSSWFGSARSFSSLKTERIGRRTYRTRNHAKAGVFVNIVRFYNPTRRRLTLGYLSPRDSEREAQVA
ncbi:IS3 family transposase [Sphingomonas sp. 8AM]|uniref:IS3 family transposase n=1 Tax=Sphingomonas sp. 8AM TaxID=2653170 RepID=UPI0012F30BA3